jgi:23S rRNA pseudouridine1911/1915/1917 synthase
MSEAKILTAGTESAGERADVFLAAALGISRANCQKLLKDGLAATDGKTVKANQRLRGGEVFLLYYQPPQPLQAEPEDLPIDIVYQDKDLLVVNKARGMVVHPAPGARRGTLVNALLYAVPDLSGINGCIRPGIVHRLDKDTSGLMVVAKHDAAHLALAAQIKDKTAVREYLAIVHGAVKTDEGLIETLIGRDPKDRRKMAVVREGGREAATRYQVLERFRAHSLIKLRLFTGRTHQIRVHLAYLGHPVVGDPCYLPRRHGFAITGQALHSHTLAITDLGGARREFTAEPPADMAKILDRLRKP